MPKTTLMVSPKDFSELPDTLKYVNPLKVERRISDNLRRMVPHLGNIDEANTRFKYLQDRLEEAILHRQYSTACLYMQRLNMIVRHSMQMFGDAPDAAKTSTAAPSLDVDDRTKYFPYTATQFLKPIEKQADFSELASAMESNKDALESLARTAPARLLDKMKYAQTNLKDHTDESGKFGADDSGRNARFHRGMVKHLTKAMHHYTEARKHQVAGRMDEGRMHEGIADAYAKKASEREIKHYTPTKLKVSAEEATAAKSTDYSAINDALKFNSHKIPQRLKDKISITRNRHNSHTETAIDPYNQRAGRMARVSQRHLDKAMTHYYEAAKHHLAGNKQEAAKHEKAGDGRFQSAEERERKYYNGASALELNKTALAAAKPKSTTKSEKTHLWNLKTPDRALSPAMPSVWTTMKHRKGAMKSAQIAMKHSQEMHRHDSAAESYTRRGSPYATRGLNYELFHLHKHAADAHEEAMKAHTAMHKDAHKLSKVAEKASHKADMRTHDSRNPTFGSQSEDHSDHHEDFSKLGLKHIRNKSSDNRTIHSYRFTPKENAHSTEMRGHLRDVLTGKGYKQMEGTHDWETYKHPTEKGDLVHIVDHPMGGLGVQHAHWSKALASLSPTEANKMALAAAKPKAKSKKKPASGAVKDDPSYHAMKDHIDKVHDSAYSEGWDTWNSSKRERHMNAAKTHFRRLIKKYGKKALKYQPQWHRMLP